jgi:hypothetical protein
MGEETRDPRYSTVHKEVPHNKDLFYNLSEFSRFHTGFNHIAEQPVHNVMSLEHKIAIDHFCEKDNVLNFSKVCVTNTILEPSEVIS